MTHRLTPRQRLLTAMKLQEPDLVPLAPLTPFLLPSHVLGVDLVDLSSVLGTYPVWKAELEMARKFGFDGWVSSRGPAKECGIQIPNPRVRREKRITRAEADMCWVDIIYSTPAGQLVERRCCPKKDADWVVKYLVDDPREDYGKLVYLLTPDFEDADYSYHRMIQAEVGDMGVVRLHFDTFVTWWITLRGQEGFTDFFDYPALLQKICGHYIDYSRACMKVFAQGPVDLIWLHGVFDGADLAGPRLLDKYLYPFLKAIRESTDVPLLHFLSGECMELLDREVEAGVNGLTPLEPPPIADVDLAEVKRRVGNRLFLQGNIDPIGIIELGTPEDVELRVKKCIEEAAEGGGFILAPADQITNRTPLENVKALVWAREKYGKYR